MRFNARRVILAIAAGGLTAGGLTFWGAGKQATAEPVATVLVVTKDIKASEPIKPEFLAVESRPLKYVPANALRSVGETAEMFARWNLVVGDVLLAEKLATKADLGGAPLKIPEGKRAISVAVDEVVGVAGFVQPGTVVDVIAVIAVGSEQPVSKVVLQNVPILAVAQNDETPGDDSKAKISSSVTLAVTPNEAEKLVLATERGKIRLAMRSPDETVEVKTAGSNPDSLRGVARAPAPRKPRPATKARAKPQPPRVVYVDRPVKQPKPKAVEPDPVEVIRGNRVEHVNL